jgi:hypothetical protein
MSAAQDHSKRAHTVDVLAPVAVDTTYSYLAPPALGLQPGDSVQVPLGAREAYGVVWSVDDAERPRGNLKTVITRLDRPPLSQKLRDFIDWLARYTLTPRGMALRLATRAAEEAAPDTLRTLYRAGGKKPERLTPTRARVLEAAQGGMAFSKKALAEAAACSTGVIDGLVDEGALETIAAPPEPVARVQTLFARRRHRLRQNRSLFRGRRGGVEGRRPGPRDDAGDCAHGAISRALRGALWREAGGMALGRLRAQTRAYLARRRHRGVERRRGRALGVIPPLP